MGRFTFFCVLAAVFDTTKQQLIRVMESNFSEIVYSPYFTDKTMFIKYFMREPKHLMVLAPQGFGKSTILSMLQLFLDLQADRNGTIIQPNTTQNAPFFERVKIRREEEYYERHFAQHPVLYLNLKHLACHPSYLVFGRTFRDMIVRMLLKYKYLLRSRILVSRAPQEYYSCFKLLFQSNFNPEHFVLMGRRMTRYLSWHFDRKCVVLIDGFDAPGTRSLQPGCSYPGMPGTSTDKRILDVVGRFLTALLEGDEFVSHSLSTGVTRIGSSVVYANLTAASALDEPDLAPFFGLSETELRDIAMSRGQLHHLERLALWYGGYRAQGSMQRHFNTRSVMTFFKTGKFKRYWRTPSVMEQLRELFDYDLFGAFLEGALSTGLPAALNKKYMRLNSLKFRGLFAPYYKYSPTDNDLMVQFLLENGYLTPTGVSGNFIIGVSTPNLEMKEALQKLLYKEMFFRKKFNISGRVVKDYVEALLNVTGNEAHFRAFLNCTARIFERNFPRNEAELQAPLFIFPTMIEGAFRERKTEYTMEGSTRDVTLTGNKDGVVIILGVRYDRSSAPQVLKQVLAYNHQQLLEKSVPVTTTSENSPSQRPTGRKLIDALREKALKYKSSQDNASMPATILIGLKVTKTRNYSVSYLCGSKSISNAKTLHLVPGPVS
ncbi:unnamed protein product [Bemisia tabaci]|uniref:AAA-ATPase-like domain-containing protein n=1 Tax=Bemisia tabaci TaxID=7038 RepID=A0A9P0EZ51_BEMTA|nr:unnamed protein product [Bemisia tabaci]